MNLRWFLIIFAIGFVASLSGISRVDFWPKTNLGRGIAGFFFAVILFLIGVMVWTVLPFVLNR